jgi:DNA modification methylase
VDKADELREKWGTETGQLWQCGEHRVICGDCTDKAVVERVMGGEKADLVFTSPPYAQQRDYKQEAKASVSDWDGLMVGAFGSMLTSDAAQVLVNLGLVHRDNEWIPYWEQWIEWMRSQGWRRFGWYVWDQQDGLPGDWNGRFAPSHEFVFHFNRHPYRPKKTVPCKEAGVVPTARSIRGRDGVKKASGHAGRPVQDTKIPDSVIRAQRQKVASETTGHPAPFSVAFALVFVESWPGLVYDPFLGSGTTMIACEQIGRKCRGIEISPAYVAVILQRYIDATGEEPAKHA